MSADYRLPLIDRLLRALRRPPALLQILVGPRQVGKTTAARTVGAEWEGPVHYAAADELLPPDPTWIEAQWALARRLGDQGVPLLILDEVQKVAGWSEVVKGLWDAERAREVPLRVLILGSSALLLAHGMTESLAGRFFLHRAAHWSWPQCRDAFGWPLERWIFFGGYPGTAALTEDEDDWKAYVRDALVEPVLARDILAMQRVARPALLRHLFALSCHFPAQVFSYNKMLGQLQDAGNTTTLAEYLRLLDAAFLVTGLERFSPGRARSRGSSPKLVVWNDALVSALDLRTFEQARNDGVWWGRLVENAIGAHLLNHLRGQPFEVGYWRERDDEVDYVVRSGAATWAIEVKSGRPRGTSGLAAFKRLVPDARVLIVGRGGLPLEDFLATPPAELLGSLL